MMLVVVKVQRQHDSHMVNRDLIKIIGYMIIALPTFHHNYRYTDENSRNIAISVSLFLFGSIKINKFF